jgi:signal peptidase I
MTLRWFLSGQVREATEAYKHVRRILNAQRDLLSQDAINAVTASLAETQRSIDSNADKPALKKQIEELEKTANKFLRPYPNSGWRENVEVFLVAIAVAMAIRTFFVQPFKIPTGSMQPTLYGVTTESFANNPAVVFPTGWKRFVDATVRGTFYHHKVADGDYQLVDVRHKQVARFINKHDLIVQTASGEMKSIPVWFSPDDRFAGWVGFKPGQIFRKGEDLFKLKEVTGDHLFVDRLSYNFRRPERGDIIVFATKGIHGIREQDQFYIKRLVGLGGETIGIGPDRHAYINGVRLDASTPRFENIYSFDPSEPPAVDKYSGHFVPVPFEYDIRPNHYFVMGDNTMNSGDSRSWGDFSRENVIGKSFFVYWPIANRGESRFGLGYR